MRVKQTARKSTASTQSTSRSRDPVRSRMTNLLQTKRQSNTSRSLDESQVHKLNHSGKSIRMGDRPRTSRSASLRRRPGEAALSEIKRLQNNYELLIPRAPFHRVVKEIVQAVAASRQLDETCLPDQYKFQSAALEALQEAAEYFLVNLFEDSYLCTIHAKRVTLFVQDMHLCRRLQNIPGE